MATILRIEASKNLSDFTGVPVRETQSIESSSYGGPSFIVHKYRPVFTETTTQNSISAVLREGQDTINLVCNSKWHNVNVKRDVSFQSRPSNACYIFYKKPPEYHGKSSNVGIKDWGAPLAEDDDVYRLDDLQEFESTNFGAVAQVGVETADSETRYSPPVSDEVERLGKRRRLDAGSLHNVIPQPHMHPSSSVCTPDLSVMPPYTKTPPIPISTHVTSPLPFSRNAWIVPVRGALPWAEASSAIILDPFEPSQSPLASQPDSMPKRSIVWTHPALRSFWLFLLRLREQERLGPLGVSFHVVKTSFKRANKSLRILNDHSTLDASPNEDSLLQESGTVGRGSLSQVDYIKVYHDAQASMILRNALDVWAYILTDESNKLQSEDSKKRKIRILKGARLVLLDERSNGLLIS